MSPVIARPTPTQRYVLKAVADGWKLTAWKTRKRQWRLEASNGDWEGVLPSTVAALDANDWVRIWSPSNYQDEAYITNAGLAAIGRKAQ